MNNMQLQRNYGVATDEEAKKCRHFFDDLSLSEKAIAIFVTPLAILIFFVFVPIIILLFLPISLVFFSFVFVRGGPRGRGVL